MLPLRDSITSSRKPVVNLFLVAINVVVFVYQWTLSAEEFGRLVFTWGAVPANFHPLHSSPIQAVVESPTLLTSMFLHGSPMHVGFNMLYLWIFGDNVEDRLGHWRYLLFYIACGLAATATQMLFQLSSEIPIIGASGAIGGVMGAYLIAYPRAKVLTFIWLFVFVRFFWVPAVFYLGLWFALQLLQALQGWGVAAGEAGQGGVAFWAHVGGFAMGVILILAMRKQPGKGRATGPENEKLVLFDDRRGSRYR